MSTEVPVAAPDIGEDGGVEAGSDKRVPVQDGNSTVQDGKPQAGAGPGTTNASATVPGGPLRLEGEGLLAYVRPTGTLAPYFSVPAVLRDALVSWRSELGRVRGLMALAQLLLFSSMRNEHGVVATYEMVYRAFGLTPSTARNDGVYTGPLLELYRDRIDPELVVLSHDSRRSLARTVVETGFPEEVLDIVHRFRVTPDSFDRFVYLIDGRSADRRNTQSQINTERKEDAMTNEPAVPMPQSAIEIQAYLNLRLGDQLFTNGRYGIASRLPATRDRVNEMAARSEIPFDTEAKADAALRTLAWMRDYPRPLYKPCDHSPRLKADHYNQMMNLSSALRPALYTERDFELDLDKAHMAALVVVAGKLGMETPLLSEALQDPSRDLWSEFADRFDAVVLTTPQARRKAAKRSYALVYGSSENNLLREMLNEYLDRGGRYVGTYSFAPFRPVMEHPVLAEVYQTAQDVLAHIEKEGGLHDAEGRWISLEMFRAKKPEDRPKTLLAYVCASYEQVLVAEAFREAADELEHPSCYGRPAFWIWLYQADGFTLRLSAKADAGEVIGRLQRAVARKAAELGMPTRLSVE